MASKDQIRDLLGTGIGNEIVASAVGVDPSYISQLLSDATFAQEVEVLRIQALTANNARDRSIDTLEDRIIDKLNTVLDMGQIYKPMEVVRALQVVNGLKRRGISSAENITINNNIVQLTIPKAAKKAYIINEQGTVIEADGQTLVTMPTGTLLKQLADKSENGGEYEKLSRNIPVSAASGK